MQRTGPIETLVGHLKSEGWCLVEDVIPRNCIEAVCDEITTGHRQAIEDYDAWGGSLPMQKGPNGQPGRNVVAYIPKLASYFADERVLAIAQTMLDLHVRIAQTEFKTLPPNYRNIDHRGYHSDWPHDLTDREQAGAVRMPFPNVAMGLTTLWMLSPFSPKNGGTWVVPRSHLDLRNPRSNLDPRNPPELHDNIDPIRSIPGEIQLSGSAGSVIIIDSRIWHSTAFNPSSEPRVTVVARYSPWWISLEFGGRNRAIIPRESYLAMSEPVKLLYRHRAEGEADPIRQSHERAFERRQD
ncbi:MAG: phytanoyl-CoA dioxygenase family protein [Candidatus Latescibacterota bacterium]|nr:phytanoyl-CoA dioxygenase family protein [Candidatus Latescibacterota bacterium]